jgi:hypothetical protein
MGHFDFEACEDLLDGTELKSGAGLRAEPSYLRHDNNSGVLDERGAHRCHFRFGFQHIAASGGQTSAIS